jgi:hypothetical protein
MFLPSPPSLPSNTILQLIALTLCLTQVQIAVCGVSSPPNIHNDATKIIHFLIGKSHGSESPKTIEYHTEDPNPNTEKTKPPSKGKIFRKASFQKKSKEQDVKKDIDNNAYPASKHISEDSLSFKIMKMLSTISIHLSKGKDIYTDTNKEPIEDIETAENIDLFKLFSKADIDSLNIALEESRHSKKDEKRGIIRRSFRLFRKSQSQKEEITSSQVINKFKQLIEKFLQDEDSQKNSTKNTQSSQNDIDEKCREKMKQQDLLEKFYNRIKAEQDEERHKICKINWTSRPQSAPPIQVADSRIRQSLRNYRKKNPQKNSTRYHHSIINSSEYTDKTRAKSLKHFPHLRFLSDTDERKTTGKHSEKVTRRTNSMLYHSKPTSEKQKGPASVVYLGEKPNHKRPSSAPLDRADCNRKTYRSRSNPKQPESTLKNPIKFKSYGPLDRDYEQNESQSGKRVRQVTIV